MKWLETKPESYDRGIRWLTLGRITRIRKQIVEKHIHSDMNVLEIGCGTGELACLMAQNGAKVTAIDSAPAMLTIAEERVKRENLSHLVELERRSAIDIDEFVPSRKFDLIVASHTLAELYAVLSTLPIKPRISPAVAWRLVHENIVAISKVIALTSAEYSDVLKQVSQSGLIGGIVYDALIARVAQKAKVQRLLTFNSEHFRRVWPTGEHIILNP